MRGSVWPRVARWMYRSGHPNPLARVMNRVSVADFERIADRYPVFRIERREAADPRSPTWLRRAVRRTPVVAMPPKVSAGAGLPGRADGQLPGHHPQPGTRMIVED